MSDACVPSEVQVAAGLLFDVLVLAGGASRKLAPLCNDTPKAMIQVCNRPIIWYCLRPWVEKGCRTFFICCNEDAPALKEYLKKYREEFTDVKFVYVELPQYKRSDERPDEQSDEESSNTESMTPTTSCHAVQSYLQVKEKLLPEAEGRPRDVLILSCDSLIPGVDVGPFINHFYTSFASASVLLAKPAMLLTDVGDDGKSLTNLFSVSEPIWTIVEGVEGPSGSDSYGPQHLRLHLMEENMVDEVSAGFVARRLHVVARNDLCDMHVYLVKEWVARYIAANADDGITVRKIIIPLLARKQFWSINTQRGAVEGPDVQLGYPGKIPQHWALPQDSTRSIGALNAAQGTAPRSWDVLRVECSIYTETLTQKLCRINTREKYLAMSHEIIHALLAKKQGLATLDARRGTFALPNMVLSAALKKQQDLAASIPFIATSEKIPKRIVDSLLGSFPTHESLNISRSIIGQNVVFGQKVSIKNSVIMDGADIGDKAVITDSVVCSRCVVPAGSKVNKKFVNGEYKDEPDESD